MRNHILFSPIALFFLSVLAFTGCNGLGGDSITLSLLPAGVKGEYLYGHDGFKPTIQNSWSTSGYSFSVYLEQGGKIMSAGMVETQERSIAEKDKTSFVTIKFAAPKSLDTSAPYRIIAFDKDATVSLTDNVLVCKQPLVRNTNHLSCWYLADAEGGAVSSAQGALLATCECIWINNKTGKTIKVKHKGWDVSEKWYCTDADVQLSYAGSIRLQTSPKSTASEVVSGAKEIAGGEEGFIMSGFVPTGSAIRNAVLVLEIDGKEVKSKPLSYDNVIKHGIPYYATADWDGNTLEWTKE